MKGLAFHSHKHDALSTLIKALTRSQYCHAAILIDNPEWRAKVIAQFLRPVPSAHATYEENAAKDAAAQATGHLIIEEFYPKVRTRFLENDELSEIDVFDVPSHTAEMEAKSMDYMIAQLVARLPYDIPDLFRFSQEFRAAMGETKDDAWKRHQFCSQFRFNSYRMGGTLLLNMHDFNYSPAYMGISPLEFPMPKLLPIAASA